MRAVAATAAFFAPELEVVQFPAWDCLPYDRASPTLRVMAERIGALHRLQAKPKGPQLFLTTVNAATQRVLTPFRLRQLVATLAPNERIGRDDLATLLQANGYVRTDTVHDQGEYAVRGGLVDLYPSGEEQALRLDFFGDEIESVRTFDPQDQRTTGRIDGFTLLPASEALLDAEQVKRFRSRYRESVRRDGDRRSALSGGVGGAAAGGHGALAAAVRGQAGNAVWDHLGPWRRWWCARLGARAGSGRRPA